MKILPYQTASSSHNFTSRAGLVVPAELIKRLELSERVDQAMPKPGSNRGYKHSTIFNTYMLMFHEGAKCLDDVRHLHKEGALMNLVGITEIPSVRTLGNWLRSSGDNAQAVNALEQVNRYVLGVSLGDTKRVTLDIDATVIGSKKKDAKWTYKKHKGYVPIVGHIAETGQVVACEFREGNVAPAAQNVEFFSHCRAALPEGVAVNRFRADSATYQAQIINDCREHNIRFAIRAKMDSSVKESVTAIRDHQWKPVVDADGIESETDFVGRTVHVMEDTKEAFCLVVQKKWVEQVKKTDADGAQPEGPEQLKIDLRGEGLHELDDESAVSGKYIYRAIATDLDLENFSDDQVVWWYNQRADASENRLKELRSDFYGAHLPCSDFKANAVYMTIASIAYNLLALMRMKLPRKWFRTRAITLRHRLYDIAGQVVFHARQWTLKVRSDNLRVLDEALWSIRCCRLT